MISLRKEGPRLELFLDKLFNFEEIAKRALARHWRKRTDKEKKEFTALFSNFLEGSYIGKIEAYTDEEVVYVGEKVDKGRAVVKTKVISKGIETPIHYRLLKGKGSEWMVYDVVIEGVSFVRNYRTQFNEVIKKSSYEELVKRLRSKVKKK